MPRVVDERGDPIAGVSRSIRRNPRQRCNGSPRFAVFLGTPVKTLPSRQSPETLLVRYRDGGDPEALGALFDATAPGLFRLALTLTPDAATAEDAVQET